MAIKSYIFMNKHAKATWVHFRSAQSQPRERRMPCPWGTTGHNECNSPGLGRLGPATCANSLLQTMAWNLQNNFSKHIRTNMAIRTHKHTRTQPCGTKKSTASLALTQDQLRSFCMRKQKASPPNPCIFCQPLISSR